MLDFSRCDPIDIDGVTYSVEADERDMRYVVKAKWTELASDPYMGVTSEDERSTFHTVRGCDVDNIHQALEAGYQWLAPRIDLKRRRAAGEPEFEPDPAIERALVEERRLREKRLAQIEQEKQDQANREAESRRAMEALPGYGSF